VAFPTLLLFQKSSIPIVLPHPLSRHASSSQTFCLDDSRFFHSLFLYLRKVLDSDESTCWNLLTPDTKLLLLLSLVAFLALEEDKSHMQPLASRALPTACFYAWTPNLSCQSIGLLTMRGWWVDFCLEGSMSLLHSLCRSVSVCSSSLLLHFPSSSKVN